MPDDPANVADIPPSRKAREDVQLMVGQIHGMVSLAVNDADDWIPKGKSESDEPDLTAEDLRRAALEVHAHFGTIHAALNSGKCDEALFQAGLGGAQGHAKKKGLWATISKYFSMAKSAERTRLQCMRHSLRWSSTIVDSITAALPKELEKFQGVALAGEAIHEFLEMLVNASEASEEAGQQPTGKQHNKKETPETG